MIQGIKEIHPQLHLKVFTATEIRWLADHVAKMSVEETLEHLVRSGLGSLTGGGAEIFAEPTRSQICKGKHSGEDWLEIHRNRPQQGHPQHLHHALRPRGIERGIAWITC